MGSSCTTEELLQIIKSRRAVRQYKEGEIPEEGIQKILEAAIWAPTGSNIQPWEFIVVKEKRNLKALKMVVPGLFGNPSLVIILCINLKRAEKGGKLGELSALMDISMSAQNMMLMAHTMGIGSCPVLSFSEPALRQLFRIPPHIKPVLLLSFGYPKIVPSPPPRRPLNEVVHYEGY